MKDKYVNLMKFLNEKNINISLKKSNYEEDNENIEKKIDRHIKVLKEFHENCMNSKEIYSLGLSSFIWKDIEELKVWNKRAEKVEEFHNNKEKSSIKKAKICIEKIYDLDYISLINRAMKRKEICIGKPYCSNVWKKQNISVIDISKIQFNMIEIDYYKYLSRIKRKRVKLPWNDVISNIIILENLNKESYMLLDALLDYPYEYMKELQSRYLLSIKSNLCDI